MEVSHQLHVPTALTQGVEPEVHVQLEAGWTLDSVRILGEGKYFFPNISTRSLVTTPTELSQLP